MTDDLCIWQNIQPHFKIRTVNEASKNKNGRTDADFHSLTLDQWEGNRKATPEVLRGKQQTEQREMWLDHTVGGEVPWKSQQLMWLRRQN